VKDLSVNNGHNVTSVRPMDNGIAIGAGYLGCLESSLVWVPTDNIDGLIVCLTIMSTAKKKSIDLSKEKLYESYPYIGIIVEELPSVELLILAYSSSVIYSYELGDRIKVSKETIEEWSPSATNNKEV
jgi:hypothetical protein